LIERVYAGKRRPLLIVYDEGHNLSEQQTELLAELEPDAYLLASATLKLPSNFQKSVIQPITLWVEEADDPRALAALKATDDLGKPEAERFITTAVSSDKVVQAQLVKKAIQFDGSTATMERSLDDLIKRMQILDTEIIDLGLGFRPKAIYVCKTNIADDGEKDDASKPFEYRKAPPIRIWRYLVEDKGLSPKDIAIYANLTFVEGNKPDEVNLFSKGENDFDEFRTEIISTSFSTYPYRKDGTIPRAIWLTSLGIGVSFDQLLAGADTLRRAVTALHAFNRWSVKFNQHRVVDIATECAFNRPK
jgi:type III restriction enzyme